MNSTIFICSYSYGELHNLQEFEKGEISDDNFHGYENDPSLQNDIENVDKSAPSATSRSLLKTRLSGHERVGPRVRARRGASVAVINEIGPRRFIAEPVVLVGPRVPVARAHFRIENIEPIA